MGVPFRQNLDPTVFRVLEAQQAQNDQASQQAQWHDQAQAHEVDAQGAEMARSQQEMAAARVRSLLAQKQAQDQMAQQAALKREEMLGQDTRAREGNDSHLAVALMQENRGDARSKASADAEESRVRMQQEGETGREKLAIGAGKYRHPASSGGGGGYAPGERSAERTEKHVASIEQQITRLTMSRDDPKRYGEPPPNVMDRIRELQDEHAALTRGPAAPSSGVKEISGDEAHAQYPGSQTDRDTGDVYVNGKKIPGVKVRI